MDRRKFLKTSPLAAAALATGSAAQQLDREKARPQPIPPAFATIGTILPNRMASKMKTARDGRKSDLAKLTSPAAAQGSRFMSFGQKCVGILSGE